MDADTYPRRDVQAWLATMVCVKLNGGADGGAPEEKKRFAVEGFPTLVLLDPTGKVLHNEGGAPAAAGFVEYFAADRYNTGIRAYNKKRWEAAAPHMFFVRKWFPGTKLAKECDRLHKICMREAAYAKAYLETEAAFKKGLEAARAVIRAEEERRAIAAKMKAAADKWYEKYMRQKAYKIYKQIIWEYPDLPEAEAARNVLRSKKQKWKEPTGR